MIKKEKILKSACISITTIIAFVILFTKINIQDVLTVLLTVDAKFLILAIIVSIFANVFLASDKWRRILKEIGCHIPFRESLLIMTGSGPIRFILPFKSGEAAKAIYLKRKKNLGYEFGLSSLLFDKFSNLFGTLVLLYIGLFFYETDFSRKAVLSSCSLVGVLSLGTNPRILPTLAAAKLKTITIKGYDFFKKIFLVLKAISLRKKVELLLYSVIIQFSAIVTAYIACRALDLTIPFSAMLVFIPVIILLSNVPVTVSGLGVREASVVFLFFRYGSQERLLSVGILISFIEHILPAMLGLFFLRTFLRKAYK